MATDPTHMSVRSMIIYLSKGEREGERERERGN